jgi:hypothetical protein
MRLSLKKSMTNLNVRLPVRSNGTGLENMKKKTQQRERKSWLAARVPAKYKNMMMVLEVVTCLHIIANVWLHLPPLLG